MELGVFNLNNWISLEDLVKTKIEDFSVEEDKTYTLSSLGVGEVYAANCEVIPSDKDIVGDYIPSNGFVYEYTKQKDSKETLFLKSIGEGIVRIIKLENE